MAASVDTNANDAAWVKRFLMGESFVKMNGWHFAQRTAVKQLPECLKWKTSMIRGAASHHES
jgi:hypothetical protein